MEPVQVSDPGEMRWLEAGFPVLPAARGGGGHVRRASDIDGGTVTFGSASTARPVCRDCCMSDSRAGPLHAGGASDLPP